MVVVGEVVDDRLVRQLLVRLAASQGQHLPQRHPERPHVTMAAEVTLKKKEEKGEKED